MRRNCSSLPASELRTVCRDGTLITLAFESDDAEKVKICATVDSTQKSLDPFTMSISEPNALEKLASWERGFQSNTVSHKHRINTKVTQNHYIPCVTWKFLLESSHSIYYTKATYLTGRYRKLYKFYDIKNKKHIFHLLPSQEHVQDHVLPIWYRCHTTTFETSRWEACASWRPRCQQIISDLDIASLVLAVIFITNPLEELMQLLMR